jgi:hypothetical protein
MLSPLPEPAARCGVHLHARRHPQRLPLGSSSLVKSSSRRTPNNWHPPAKPSSDSLVHVAPLGGTPTPPRRRRLHRRRRRRRRRRVLVSESCLAGARRPSAGPGARAATLWPSHDRAMTPVFKYPANHALLVHELCAQFVALIASNSVPCFCLFNITLFCVV